MRLIEFNFKRSVIRRLLRTLAHVALARYICRRIYVCECKHSHPIFISKCTACSNAQKGHSQIALKMSYTYH